MASSMIGALRVNLGINSAKFTEGLDKAQSKLGRFGKFAAKGMAGAVAGVTAAAAGLTLALKGTINEADRMAKASQKVGIPIETFSRLAYAADMSGVSVETLETGMTRLSVNMANAAKGVGEARGALKTLGISATDANGNLKSSVALAMEVADKFAGMADGTEKSALAYQLGGRAFQDMIPMVNGGSAALKAAMQEADTFGRVFTQAMGNNAQAFNDNMARLSGVLTNLAAKIAERLMPHLVQFTDWLVANSPAIVQFAQDLFGAVESVAKFGASIVTMAAEADAAMQNFALGIHEWLKGMVLGALDNVISKVQAVGDSFAWLYDKVVGNSWVPDMVIEIGQWMDRLQQTMVKPAENAVAGTASAIEGLGEIGERVGSSIGQAFSGVINRTTSLKDAVTSTLAQIGSALLQSGLNGMFGGSAGGGFMKALLGSLTGFASGGSFKVGGTGGIDSQLVAFRASPSESVHVTKPGQSAAGHGGGDTKVVVHNNTGQPARTERKQGPNGLDFIEVFIGERLASGRFDKQLNSRYNLATAKGQF